MQLHERITMFRREKGFTQERMAENLNLSRHGYANIEHGKTNMKFSQIKQISDILEIELGKLLGLDKGSVLNNIAESQENFFNNYVNHTDKNCQHELEKAHLIIERQNIEIAYLKNVIELMKRPNKAVE